MCVLTSLENQCSSSNVRWKDQGRAILEGSPEDRLSKFYCCYISRFMYVIKLKFPRSRSKTLCYNHFRFIIEDR